MKAAIPLALLLAACSKQATPPTSDNKAEAQAPKPVAPAAKAFAFDEQTDLLEFHFGWSAETAAIPQLVSQFRKEMEDTKGEILAEAKVVKEDREKGDFPFNPLSSSTDYKTAGE